MRLLVLVTLLSATLAEDLQHRNPAKRGYVCPPNFMRQGRKCYFLSKYATTWQGALFRCRDLHSNIAIVKNAYQDKLLRNLLSKRIVHTERWLGGVYDWGNKTWKWAASGKRLSYSGFPEPHSEEDKNSLRWQCIVMDPSLEYRWSPRSCVEEKHFICQTRIKNFNKKKEFQRRNNVDKSNEVLSPSVPDYENTTLSLKSNLPVLYKIEMDGKLSDRALFAFSPKGRTAKRRAGNGRRQPKRLSNGAMAEVAKQRRKKHKTLRDFGQPTPIKNIRWKTYEAKEASDPLYPNPIVEEYNFVKEH